MAYSLKTSQSDRINFDEWAWRCGYESFNADDLDPALGFNYDPSLYEPDLQDQDPEMGNYVDDLAEARLRWNCNHALGYQAKKEAYIESLESVE